MILTEPKKILASFFLVYIFISTTAIVDNFSHRAQHIPREITGRSTGTVSVGIVAACSIALREEYNVISLCAELQNQSVDKVIENIRDKVSFILRWNTTKQGFDVYSPDAADNDFIVFHLNESYVFFMEENATLTVIGPQLGINNSLQSVLIGDMNISLDSEFNAPGYPYIFATNVSKYITPIEDNVYFLLKWNVTTQKFITYSPRAASQDFTTIGKGEGQFIFMLNPAVLKYNRSDLEP
jgi:hypothetical protein